MNKRIYALRNKYFYIAHHELREAQPLERPMCALYPFELDKKSPDEHWSLQRYV